jgi:hypothetical protein
VHKMNFATPGSLPAIGAVVSGKAEATCLAYHESGKRLYVSSSLDSRLQVIDCLEGKADQPALRCEREKIDIFEPTYVNAVLLRSTNVLKTLTFVFNNYHHDYHTVLSLVITKSLFYSPGRALPRSQLGKEMLFTIGLFMTTKFFANFVVILIKFHPLLCVPRMTVFLQVA